jgi:hypothetical protein
MITSRTSSAIRTARNACWMLKANGAVAALSKLFVKRKHRLSSNDIYCTLWSWNGRYCCGIYCQAKIASTSMSPACMRLYTERHQIVDNWPMRQLFQVWYASVMWFEFDLSWKCNNRLYMKLYVRVFVTIVSLSPIRFQIIQRLSQRLTWCSHAMHLSRI